MNFSYILLVVSYAGDIGRNSVETQLEQSAELRAVVTLE